MASIPDDEKKRQVALGQFYTPKAITDFMVSQIKNDPAHILEAGYGQGAFLDALVEAGFKNIEGHELDPANTKAVSKRLGKSFTSHQGDFVLTSRQSDCDAVIGNPPYVSWNNIPSETKDFLTSDSFWSNLSNGEWDLLYAFLILSIERLKPGGQLLQIIPTNWFYSTHAASLRNYLTEQGYVKQIIHFGEAKLFNDCAPNTIILDYRKLAENEDKPALMRVADYAGRSSDAEQIINDLEKVLAGKEVKDWSLFDALQPEGDHSWYLATPSQQKFCQKLIDVSCHQELKDVASVAVGMVSGGDAAFILDEELAKTYRKSSPSLITNFVKAANCSRYKLLGSAPYIWADTVKNEETLEEKHKEVFAHLDEQRVLLENRYLAASKEWFAWATVRNLQTLQTPVGTWKIFIPCIDRAEEPRFCASDQGELSAGDVLTIVPEENSLYYLAWLNSQYVSEWYRIRGARSGKRWLYTQAFVSRIPVLVPGPEDKKIVAKISKLAEKALSSGKSDDDAINDLFEEIIDKRKA